MGKQEGERHRAEIGSNDWNGWRGEKWRSQLDAMRATLRDVDRALIDRLDLSQPMSIVDIGCGGGATTRALANSAHRSSRIQGLDISPPLIDVAQQQNAGFDSTITYEVSDVQRDTANRGPYDLLVSRFGVMFFEDPNRAFRNIARWVQPGAPFLFAVWGKPSETPAISDIKAIIGEVIDLPSPTPHAPGPFRYGDPTMLLDSLAQSGFSQLKAERQSFELPVGGSVGAHDAANFVIQAYSNFSELLSEAGPETFNVALERVRSHLSKFEQNGVVHMEAMVQFVSGLRNRSE